MNKTKFVTALKALSVNFDIEIKKGYTELAFSKLQEKGLTDQDFLKAVNLIIDTQSNLFKMPTIAMLLEHCDKRELTPEQQATVEAESIIDTAQAGCSRVIFDNQFTNMTAEKYGLGYIDNQLNNNYLDKRKDRSWIKKELTEIWLNCYYDQKTKSTAVIKNQESSSIEFIGDKDKCQILLNSPKPIEDRSPALDKLVSSLSLKQKPRKFNFEAAKKKQLEFLGAANSNEIKNEQKLN